MTETIRSRRAEGTKWFVEIFAMLIFDVETVIL